MTSGDVFLLSILGWAASLSLIVLAGKTYADSKEKSRKVEKVAKSEQKIFDYIFRRRKARLSEIVIDLGIDRTTVLEVIRSLKSKGFIEDVAGYIFYLTAEGFGEGRKSK